MLAVLACALGAAQTQAEQLLETDGIVLYGTVALAQENATKCRLVKDKYTEEEWESMQHNVGKPLHLWKLKFSVENQSGKALDHLIALYSIDSPDAPCNYWDPINGISIEWGGSSGFIQETAEPFSMAPGDITTKEINFLTFHTDTPRFADWSVSFTYADEAGQKAAKPYAQADTAQAEAEQADLGSHSKNCAQWNTAEFFDGASSVDIQACLNAGADPNAVTTQGNTPLIFAAQSCDDKSVTKLIESGAYANARNKFGESAVFKAVRCEKLDVLAALLKARASVRALNQEGKTPLHYARSAAIVGALMQAGADVNLIDRAGNSPLFSAILELGNRGVVEALIEAGADIRGNEKSRKIPIYAAANGWGYWNDLGDEAPRHELDREMDALLGAGADPNATLGEQARSLLMLAIRQEHKDAVAGLLRAGADPNLKDKEGNNAMVWAAFANDEDYLRLLLENGGNPNARFGNLNARNSYGDSVLEIIIEGGSADAVQLVLSAGADPNTIDDGDQSMFFSVTSRNDAAAKVALLLEAGVDLEKPDFSGDTPLISAAHGGDPELVSLFFRVGANLEARNKYGQTALIMATQNWNESFGNSKAEVHKEIVDTVRVLLNLGSQVNAKSDDGNTALMLAARGGQEETVRVLLEAGADVNLSNENGDSALSLALNNGHNRVVDLLQSAGAN